MEGSMLRQLRPVLAVAFAMAFLVAGSGETFGASRLPTGRTDP